MYIGLINSAHFAYTKAALLAGKHVILEKPLTSTVQEALELARISEQTGCYVLEAIKRMNNRPKLSQSQLTLFYLENKHPEGEQKNNLGCMVRLFKVVVLLFSVPPLLNPPLLHRHLLRSPSLCLPPAPASAGSNP